ncbi:unnamed protein product [Paramecium pentaurelia]|uniref:Uncharacterized protein n=1 Tax=Paramecium pentaurelia TaxID=43138 RepID=A0A8S1VWC7_9CILI|nr:unnamed protein product [Paramecium pentaurelia]
MNYYHIKFSFSNSVKELIDLILNKNFNVAQQQINKILFQDQVFPLRSKEYIKLLHYQSILQLYDRNYQDAEISIQNAMLQSKYINEKTYHTYLTLYYQLISYTNINEIHWKIKQMKKQNQYSELSLPVQAKIMNCLAIGNIFSTSDCVAQSVELLKTTAQLYPDLQFTNYYNIAAIYYLFDQSTEKNDIIIDNLIKCYKCLRQNTQDINGLEDLWIQYNLIQLNELTIRDVKILLLLSQHLFSNKYTKLALQFLNLSNKIISLNSICEIYKTEMQFIYAAYFLDQKQVQNCTDICRTLLKADIHPIQDQIKLNALRLANKSTTIISKKIVVNQQAQNKKAYRELKQKNEFQDIQAKEQELLKQFNLQKPSAYYYQFDSDFKEIFNIKFIEIDILLTLAKQFK